MKKLILNLITAVALMRKSIGIIGLLTLGFAGAQASVIFYDSFSYTSGQNLTIQTNWAPLNTGTPPVVASGNLTVTGLQAPTGNSASWVTGNIQEALCAYTSQNSGTVFYSFAFQITSVPAATTYSFALSTGNTGYSAAVWVRADGSGFNLGVSNRSNSAATYSTTTLALNTTYFVVGSYTFNAGTGDDSSSLWINPSSADFGAGAAPTATLTATGGTDMTAVSQFLIRGATGSPSGIIDELRVGTTWADVTTGASLPIPVISGELSGSEFVVTCTSSNGIYYQLQSSTDLSTWTNAGLAQVGTGGDLTFAAAAPANPGDKVFYQVDVSFSPPAAPAITNLSPIFANVGGVVVITGTNLNQVTGVTVGGVPASYTGSATSLSVTVPAGATTGNLVVSGPYGSDTSHNLVVVTDPSLFVASEEFSGGLGSFTTYSVASNKNWVAGSFSDSRFVEMNGFGGDVASDDWLISPAINLAGVIGSYMLLGHERGFDGPALQVKVSTDYVGGDPTLATWTDLTVPLAANFTNVVTDTGATSLSAWDGQTIHIAVRYTSTGTASGTGARDRIHYFAVGGN